jgi:hypothetical protein
MTDGKTVNQTKDNSKYKDSNYVRVTEALGVLDKGEGMKHWYYKFKSYSEMMEALRKSAERGSKIDETIKLIYKGDTTVVAPPELSGYMTAFMKWRQEWRFNCMQSDLEVFDEELKYVGTLDMYGELYNSKTVPRRIIIDIKTGEPGRNKDGTPKYDIYDSMFQQTAAYKNAMPKSHGVRVDENWVLRLFSDGSYVFQPDPDYTKNFTIFKHALAIKRLQKYGTERAVRNVRGRSKQAVSEGSGGESVEEHNEVS